MASGEREFEEQLEEAGNRLLQPPSSVDELLPLLDQVENFLSRVEQSPLKSMQTALSPSMKALVADKLLRHPDVDVKVAVASCISEITRITAPDAPYDDDQMKDVFQLIVSSFENLSDKSSRSYNKRTLILETVAKVRSCVVMLDLECDGLIVEMFHHFLKAIRDYHPENVFSSMVTIMSLVLEESEDISVELISPILASLKKDNQEVLPIARKLGERVFENCATKVKPYLIQAKESLGHSFDDYSKVIASICDGTTDVGHNNDGTVRHNDDDACGEQLIEESKLDSASSEGAAQVAVSSPKRASRLDKDEVHLEETTKTNSKRKRMPGKEKASDAIEYDSNLIGKKVKVWWPDDDMFYEGVIDGFDPVKMKHKVSYTDGDEEILNLRDERWELVSDSSESDGEQAAECQSPDPSSNMLDYPGKMSSSSIGGGEGPMLRFMSKKCRCGRKAAIRIVESEKPSKGRLYYVCENAGLEGCDLWAWCNPVGYAPIYGRDEIDDEKSRVEEGVQFNGRLMKLEMKMEALTMMMKTSMVILLACFISTMLMFSMK